MSLYLSEDLVALAFFDDSVPIEKKYRVLLAMKTVDGDEVPAKRIKIDLKALHEKDFYTSFHNKKHHVLF